MKIPPILGVQNWGYISLREGVFFPWDDESVIAFTIFSICHSPQKSSTTQKVYKRLRGQGPSLYNLSVSLRSTAPLVGEPLAKPFTLRGLPKPPLPGEVARRRRDGEVVRRKACPRTRPMTERFTPKRYSLYTDTSLVYPESMIK